MTETAGDEGEKKAGLEEEDKEPAKFMIGASEDEFPDYEFEEVIATNHVVPPDGGWGWVVVAASFLCNVVVDGIIFSAGLLLKDFQKEFNVSTSQVSWVSSLLGGFYLIVGPFVSGLANAYGFRVVCILGAILGSIAFGASYFAPNIFFLYFSFGIVGGTGFGLIYVPAVIATGFYFEKKRALATGIAVCGSGIGTFIFAPLNTNLLASMGWRWTLVVYACVISSCAIYGLAFRPLEPNSMRTPDDDVDPPGTPLLMRIKKARDEQMKQCASALSMASMASNRSPSRLTMEETSLGPMPNGDVKVQGGTVAKALLERHGGPVGANAKRFSFPGIVVTAAEEPIIEEEGEEEGPDGKPKVLDNNENETDLKTQTAVTTTTTTANTTATTPTGERSPRQLTQRARYPRIESAPVLANHHSHHYDHQRRPSRLALRTEMARPFYREDIFFSGSMNRIPQYQSSETVDKYHASVTQLPPMEAIAEEEASQTYCRCCPTAMVYVINKMFDFSLLASPTFIVLCIAGFMSLLALFVPFMFLPGYAEMQGADDGTKSTLVLLIGIANTAGRVICGGLSDHPKVDALYVNNLSLIMGGVATIALPFLKDISLMYAYSLVFGFAVAAFASLRSILLVELLGLEKLTNAFGLLLLFQGIAAVFGGPIAGAFFDATKTYNLTFWVFGSIFALSGIICVPLRWLKRWEDRRLQRKQEEYNQA